MKHLAVVLVLAAAFPVGLFVADASYHAALGADAGAIHVDAGVAPAPTPAAAPVVTPSKLPDPVSSPGAALSAEESAWKTGVPLGIAVALYMLLGALSKRAATNSLLDRGKMPTYLAAGTASASAVVMYLTHQLTLVQALIAAGTPWLMILEADPPKATAKLSAVK